MCAYLSHFKPRSLYWGSNQRIPERAKKYIGDFTVIPVEFDAFAKGCRTLRDTCQHHPAQTVATLADEMDQVVEQQDTCIDIIAEGVYAHQRTTRDNAVRDTQAWRLAFNEKGLGYASEHGWIGNKLHLVDWLRENYPLKFKGDPIPSWRSQAAKLRQKKNPHMALSNYQSFMASTAELREAIEEHAGAAEAEIESQIDRARGK